MPLAAPHKSKAVTDRRRARDGSRRPRWGALILGLAVPAGAASVVDPATGNVYALGAGGHLVAASGAGRRLWERWLSEDFGLAAAASIRPRIEGGLVIVAGRTSGWGEQAPVAHRFLAFDTRTGETAWVRRERRPKGARVQVTPTELVLRPREWARFRAELFDAGGRSLGDEASAAWTLAGLEGAIDDRGHFAASAGGAQAGSVRARVGALSGEARARVVPPLPWSFDFEGQGRVPLHWVGAAARFVVREEGGRRVLAKRAGAAPARVFMGSSGLFNYTVDADVLARGPRGRRGVAGLVAQRCALLLSGPRGRLELQPLPPAAARPATVPFAWRPDTWYHLRLRVENHGDAVRAFAKAWAVGAVEPAEWTLERVDPAGHRQGSPGLRVEAPAEVLFDNVKVEHNR